MSKRSPDLETLAQHKAEAHLEACMDALMAEDATPGDEDYGREIDSPACAPFDGCTTCIVREVLYAVWDIIETGEAGG